MKIIKASKVKELDRIVISKGIRGEILMARAATGISRILKFFQELRRGRILFICGRGNNGGDGMVSASILKEEGFDVEVFLIAGKQLRGEANWAYKICKEKNVRFLKGDEVFKEIKNSTYIVDCIFGTGFRGEIKGEIKRIIEEINKSNKIVISCDIPSGINGDTGKGSNVFVKADFTITIGYPKKGLYECEGYFSSGTIFFVDIGLDRVKEKAISMITSIDVIKSIKFFAPDSYKYKKGHTLVIAGNEGMIGAGILSVKGALRTGCGIVSISSIEDVLRAINFYEPQVLTCELKNVFNFIKQKKVNSIVFGPGLGKDEKFTEILKEILKLKIPVVIDADGIFHYSKLKNFKNFKNFKNKILTPHEGEMKYLIKSKGKRIEKLKNLMKKEKGVIVLKGFRTLIGQKEIFINPAGCNILSQAGSGDLLSGFIGGVLSQGIAPVEAAKLGTFIHGISSDFAKIKYGRTGVKLKEIEEMMPLSLRAVYERHI